MMKVLAELPSLHFLSQDFNTRLALFMHAASANVNLAHPQANPTLYHATTYPVFSWVWNWQIGCNH
jgi:hypothetical protein